MKSLSLLLLSVFFFSSNVYSRQKVRITGQVKDDVFKTVDELFNGAWKGRSDNHHRVKSETMKGGIFEIIDGLYSEGYARPDKIQTYYNNYLGRESNEPDSDNWLNKGKWKRIYKDYATYLINDINDNALECAVNGEMATVRQCCEDSSKGTLDDPMSDEDDNIVKRSIIGFVPGNWGTNDSCKSTGVSCVNHNECCSSQCMKANPSDASSAGTCAVTMGCFDLVAFKNECHPFEKPYCKSLTSSYHPDTTWGKIRAIIQYFGIETTTSYPVSCIRVNHESTGANECTGNTKSCGSNEQCCSDKCESGKCVANFRCNTCVPNGQKTIDRNGNDLELECCPGTYKNMNQVCVPKFPPLVLPQSNLKIQKNKSNKNIFQILFNIIIPSAHASESVCSAFSAEQQDTLKKADEDCRSKASEEEINTCLKTKADTKKGFMVENAKLVEEKATEAKIECNKLPASEREKCVKDTVTPLKAGCAFQMSAEDYVKLYNVPAINNLTFSVPDTCTFNSYKDNWRDAGPEERNAEMVMMGFEYVFSGKGAQDYWIQKGKSKNIFQRAQSVAMKYRNHRVDLILKARTLDYELTCDCVFAKKGQGISDTAKYIFDTNPICAEQNSKLAAIISSVGDNGEDNQDRIDSGALGISHVKMLMDFAASRSNMQMDRFEANEEMEADMQELSEYIEGNNWYEAEEKVELLYQFTVKYMSTWFKIFIAIVVVIVVASLVVLSGGALGVVAVGGVGSMAGSIGASLAFAVTSLTSITMTAATFIGIGALALSTMLVGIGVNAIFKARVKPTTFDIVRVWKDSTDQSKNHNASTRKDNGKGTYRWSKGRKTNWLATHREFVIDRYYKLPYYNSLTTDSETSNSSSAPDDLKCEIYAPSNLCMRNVFVTLFQDDMRYMMDVKRPLFVESGEYPTDTNFVGMINNQYTILLDKLKATKPSGTTNKKFLKRDILNEPEIRKAMMPLSGTYSPEAFDEKRTLAVITGASRYARCKDLIGLESGGDEECRVEMNGNEFLDGAENAMGFGYLFESDQDIVNFAAYVYQHHFHWPSIGASQEIGYPLLAQSAYFQTIAHNLGIIASGARDRSLKNGDVFDLFSADWEKRKADYECSTKSEDGKSCAQVDQGSGSKNIKWSKKFRSIFKTLDFASGTVPEGIFDKNGEVSDKSGLSSAELNALKKANNMAMRSAKQLKKAEHYKKVVGSTKRGKLIEDGFKKWNTAFGKPLAKMKMEVGGRNFGAGSNLGKSNSAGSDSSNSKANKEDKMAAYKPATINYNMNSGSDYGNSYGSNRGSGSSAKTRKTGVTSDSKIKNTYLLDSALKSKSMYERDDSDSIFKIVSKAYYRNLGLILERAGVKTQTKNKTPGLDFKGTTEDLTKDKKSELKKLLSQ